MGLLMDIKTGAEARGLEFLVVGGLAVVFYGHSRDTADLDLLVAVEARSAWLDLFGKLDYTIARDGGIFLQLAAPEDQGWPVDLMLVKEASFRPMLANGREVSIFDTLLKIPSLEHLIALKLHALKHGHARRFLKDFMDVETLVRANRLDLKGENMRNLVLKYGTLELYEKISRAVAAE
jgi:predicted nucleotidyltransferase